MAILTSRAFDKKAEPEATPAPAVKETPEPEKQEEGEVKTRMVLKSVEGQQADHMACGIFDENGKTITLELDRGIYEVPGGPDHDRMVELLRKAGFQVLETVAEEGDPEPQAPVTTVPKQNDFNVDIRLQHPDYTPSNAVTAHVMVPMQDGADPQRVEIVDGIVETRNPEVVRYLQSQGYLVQNPFDLEKEIG